MHVRIDLRSFKTVEQVGSRDTECGTDAMVDSLHDLPSALPSLWQAPLTKGAQGELPLEALTACTEISVSAQ